MAWPLIVHKNYISTYMNIYEQILLYSLTYKIYLIYVCDFANSFIINYLFQKSMFNEENKLKKTK